MDLVVVKLAAAKQGCVLLPSRWVVARDFAGASPSHRLARDNEHLPQTVVGR